MSDKVVNPEYKKNSALSVSDADWAALKATITAWLATQSTKNVVLVSDIRDLDDLMGSGDSGDKVWAQISQEMDLMVIPG